jgi:hypothetical protein
MLLENAALTVVVPTELDKLTFEVWKNIVEGSDGSLLRRMRL